MKKTMGIVAVAAFAASAAGGSSGYGYRYAAADEIGCERRQPIILVLRMPILDRYVLALDIAGFLQALEKRDS